MSELHVVLGGGAVGGAVIDELLAKNKTIRCVGVTNVKKDIESVKADVCDRSQLAAALQGATHVYSCVGFPYSTKAWKHDWPVFVENLLAICKNTTIKIVYFDNIYMYGPAPLRNPFNEESAQNPTSKKGLIRKQVADMFLQAVNTGQLSGMIVRSADFYGPNAKSSMFYNGVLEYMLKGKNPMTFAKKGVPHTYAYTPDNAKAIVRLALDDTAYGQTWHLPVGEAITFDEVVKLLNAELGTTYKPKYLSKFITKIIGLFVPIVREVDEMSYQTDYPYVMSWEKLKSKYPDIEPTPYQEGIVQMIKSFNNRV